MTYGRSRTVGIPPGYGRRRNQEKLKPTRLTYSNYGLDAEVPPVPHSEIVPDALVLEQNLEIKVVEEPKQKAEVVEVPVEVVIVDTGNLELVEPEVGEYVIPEAGDPRPPKTTRKPRVRRRKPKAPNPTE